MDQLQFTIPHIMENCNQFFNTFPILHFLNPFLVNQPTVRNPSLNVVVFFRKKVFSIVYQILWCCESITKLEYTTRVESFCME